MPTDSFITILSWLVAVLAGIGVIYIRFKSGADSATNESNKILRGLIDDQKIEIKSLRERMHEMINQMTVLKVDMQILKDRREYLETLVHSALVEHLKSDPAIAKAVQSMIVEDNKK